MVLSNILITIVAMCAVVLLAGWLYQWLGQARDVRRFPPPGRLVNAGGAHLHAHVTGHIHGAGTPPVIFEAGIAASSLSWRLIEPEVAKFTQAVTYDRAGLGWSEASNDSAGGGRDVWRLVEELRAVLDRLEIIKPRVLVAHSFGGLIATAYAARYPEELAGIVLVDPVGAEEWANPSALNARMLKRAMLLSRLGEGLARLGVVRFALNRLMGGARVTPQFIARATSGRSGQAFIDRMVGQIRKLPPEVWPMIQCHWTDPKCFRLLRRQLAALPGSAASVLREAAQLDTPVMVLSAADASVAQRKAQQRLVESAPHGSLKIVEGAGHWIMLDRPDVVVAAIREMAAANPSNRPADRVIDGGR